MSRTYTVKEVNQYIHNMFEQDFVLRRISVRGEVSNCTYHGSGHIYFSLKDKSGILPCVMFAGSRGGLSFKMKIGDKVVVTGSISVFERDGKYQLYASRIEEEGKGELYERYLRLKAELEEMGMFSAKYKKPIPQFVRTVGIVTSRTGAVIQDIEDVARRRNPYVKLILCPAKVQGEGAAESIAAGIYALQNSGADVLIVGRGGGSIEDLWAFNEEIVARAIFESEIPVISAVGHETDFTIADFTADLRAPTPSAAAELAVFEYSAFQETLREKERNLIHSLRHRILRERETAGRLERRLIRRDPSSVIRGRKEELIHYQTRMEQALAGGLRRAGKTVDDVSLHLKRTADMKLSDTRHRLELLGNRLELLSPAKKLSGGYAFVHDESGKKVSSIKQINTGDSLYVCLLDGEAETVVRKEIPYDRQYG